MQTAPTPYIEIVPNGKRNASSFYSCMYCHTVLMQGYYQNFSSDFSLTINAQQ